MGFKQKFFLLRQAHWALISWSAMLGILSIVFLGTLWYFLQNFGLLVNNGEWLNVGIFILSILLQALLLYFIIQLEQLAVMIFALWVVVSLLTASWKNAVTILFISLIYVAVLAGVGRIKNLFPAFQMHGRKHKKN